MKMTSLTVSNFRGLREVAIPLSSFVCLIGENNTGKSSFLQALALVRSGTKLASSEFFDVEQPIRIEVVFDNINDNDLRRLAEEHRDKIQGIIREGRLTLIRHYDTNGKASLRHVVVVPDDPRFEQQAIDDLMRGERVGSTFADKVIEAFPELEDEVTSTMNQTAMRENIDELANRWPEDQSRLVEKPLPTGIDSSITALLPEPIYVHAVTDLSDQVKTTQSTPFGKILGILTDSLASSLPEADELYALLNTKLNRVLLADGEELDDRLEEVRAIERSVEKYVQESFADVTLTIEIPPPPLKTILASAQIWANDGVDGLIDSKGDGLRRAIVFAILRSYADLRPTDDAGSTTARSPYLLLFEEPELYLHPKGQRSLFEALRVFAEDHYVVVSTHSPIFFKPDATETFVKLRKTSNPDVTEKPFTTAGSIDLSDMTARDQFQIISYDNNHAAFFADTVVLVEGDSDLIVMPHIARTLDPEWDSTRQPVQFARISGKGNIRRYRNFFSSFDMRVTVVADLDLLVHGFEHVDPSPELKTARDELLTAVDALIDADPTPSNASTGEAQQAYEAGELRGLWQQVKKRTAELINGTCTHDDLDAAVEAFFAWQRRHDREDVLRTSDDPDLLRLKWRLLEMLRQVDVYVLERGAIEDYYPESVVASGKPSRAQSFCSTVDSRAAMLTCCGEQEIRADGETTTINEFEAIFGSIFCDVPG